MGSRLRPPDSGNLSNVHMELGKYLNNDDN